MAGEQTSPKLTGKQRRFIDQYFECGMNQSKAALLAGYSVRQSGAENMANPVIKAEIDRRLDEMAMGKSEVLARLASMARGDMREFIGLLPSDLKYHPDGGLIKKYEHNITRWKKNPETLEFESEETFKIELYDAQAALVHLGKVHKLFSDSGDTGAQTPSVINIIQVPGREVAPVLDEAMTDEEE